ncbi:GDSL-type esterase/lipase family protein [Patulibacter sp. NPDC049589]|uniref:GDSL-type esterase/lipase family protein n=1 Tax=Patulibacter sp. NPDC049589 TaxID=3154731 RepID=UPI0034406256
MSPFSQVPGEAPDVVPPEGAAIRRGVVALGDSITVGAGEPLMGVAMQSWASWVAEAFDVPVHKLARDGALAGEILRDLAPRMRGRYDVALVYAGVNDVRGDPWDADDYRLTMDALVGAATTHADRVVVATLPDDLGRPSCAPKPSRASAVVREVAAVHGALVLNLEDLGGRRLVLPDVVHPTAPGQVEMAARAVELLEADGLLGPDGAAPANPWLLADPYLSIRARLAAERRWARGFGRDVRRRAVEAAARRVGR